MKKSSLVFISGLIGAAIPVFLLGMARVFAPEVIDPTDERAAIHAVLEKLVEQSRRPDTGTIYVRSSSEQGVVDALQRSFPARHFEAFSKRPPDDGCSYKLPQFLRMGPCGRDDYVSANVVSYPVWHCAIVSFGSSNSGGQAILVKAHGRWRVLSERYYVI